MHSGSGPTVLPSSPYKHRTGKHDSGSHGFGCRERRHAVKSCCCGCVVGRVAVSPCGGWHGANCYAAKGCTPIHMFGLTVYIPIRP